ncbi:MAG TPA: dihydrofolate reductase family protein [Acidimicrobiia bacterium]
MGVKLIVTAFMTLDGVVEAPGFDEHRDGKNAWALRVQDEEDARYNREQVFTADALLLGRKTYEIWAAFWPTAAGDEELARRVNEIPKYVVSTTMRSADWNNSTLISGDVFASIGRLKEERDGDLVVYGSPTLVDGLLEHDLVDEYRLLVYPTILGSGTHMFRDGIDTHHLRLIAARTFPSGIVLLTYHPASEAPASRYVEDYAWSQEQVLSFRATQDVDRILATVLFTDLVDSTGRALELGDRDWRRLIDRHDELARSTVERWMGRFIKSTGDGMLATFDGPTRALRCAFEFREAVARLQLGVRAAIHTGEIELREGDVGGIALHIAARALEEARPQQVVVTGTVLELTTGADLAFDPQGSVSLRGIPGRWELYEASIT